jgi:hypothetical protein
MTARACICGGQMIVGPFGPGSTKKERHEEMAGALVEFLRGGARLEASIAEWASLRDRLAIDLALAQLLEAGDVDVIGTNADGEALFQRREPESLRTG